LFTFIISCAPQNFLVTKNIEKEKRENNETNETNIQKISKINVPESKKRKLNNAKISDEIEILLPKIDNSTLTRDFINAFELSLYKKNIQNIKLNINLYEDENNLKNIINEKSKPGKIFFGPLTSSDIKNLEIFCSKGIIFFSFAAEKKHAKDCIYLVNFFPEDDLKVLFENFDSSSKIALLFPENDYGYYINSVIDPIATSSKSILINRASYKEDLSNAREAIKELSNYELRKYELERQKKILKTKNDEISKKALKKIEKFETVGVVDFTHLILPEYSIRLLQIAPLLPFYDVDPSKIQFVGTGVWDNKIFFDEPTLQGSIFPGVEEKNRKWFFDEYYLNYNQFPTRTITIPYDLIGIASYIINKNLNIDDVKKLLNNKQISFNGMDGEFSFKNNVISRKLNILKISNGEAILSN